MAFHILNTKYRLCHSFSKIMKKNLSYDEENENRTQVLEEDSLRMQNLTKRQLCKVDRGY